MRHIYRTFFFYTVDAEPTKVMERIFRHFERIPPEVILLVAAGGIVVAVLFPKKYALESAIIFASAWLNLNRFKQLGDLASLSKVTFWVPLLAVIYFALLRQGPKRKVPALAWVYLVVPVLGCLCVFTTVDALYGMVQFGTMFLLAASAIGIYRVTDSEQTLIRFIKMIYLGLLVPLAISLVALVFFRWRSFIPGLGRFAPFGMAPNQLVPVLATAICLAGCGFYIFRSKVFRVIGLVTIGTSATLLLATGSRQGIVVTIVAVLPLVLRSVRRPLAMASAIVLGIGVAVWTFTFTEGVASTGRVFDFSNMSGRYDTALLYLNEFSQRPAAGLLGTSGMSVLIDESAENITHNSFIGVLYVGGLLLGLPLFMALSSTLTAMWTVLTNRKKLAINSVLLWSMAALLTSIYLHGLVSDMIYWSVSSWTFLHFYISCFFMGLANELGQVQYAPWRTPVPAT